MTSPFHQVDGAAGMKPQQGDMFTALPHICVPCSYPSAPVSGLAWKPNGLFFRQAFLSSAMRVLAIPAMMQDRTQRQLIDREPTKAVRSVAFVGVKGYPAVLTTKREL